MDIVRGIVDYDTRVSVQNPKLVHNFIGLGTNISTCVLLVAKVYEF